MMGEESLSPNLAVVHVVPDLHPRSGGPSRTVVQLTDALARYTECGVTLLSQSQIGERTVASKVAAVDRRIVSSSYAWEMRTALRLRMELIRFLRSRQMSAIHSHGLWAPAVHWAARAARHFGISLIIHPRGMLEPWALAHKAWKKRTGMALFQRRNLDSARVLIATSVQEYENIRRLGLRHPVAIIPNGVDLVSASRMANRGPKQGNRMRTVLFLSRLHPVKGVGNLLRAWAQLVPPGWRLRIAGPADNSYLANVMTEVRELKIANAVEYVGEVDGEQKSDIYNDADLFVLPTLSENFGVVVAEALAHGLPVITTRGAPWADLQAYDCGWWVDIGVEPLADALRQAIALGDAEREAMGARGRDYVRRYDWKVIAQQTAQVYSWASGRADKPDCLRLD